MEDFLILSFEQIRSLISMKECIALQEKAFSAVSSSKALNAPTSFLYLKKEAGYLKLMSCFLDGDGGKALMVKGIDACDKNPSKYGIPVVLGFLVLLDPENGLPVCLMDGSYITAIRTGAGGGLATRLLARKDSKSIGVIGTGNTASFTVRAILESSNGIGKVKVFSRKKENRDSFARQMAPYKVHVEQVESAREAVKGTDIVVTGTNSPEPVLLGDWLEPGMHLNVMGIKTEVDWTALQKSTVFGDSVEVASSDGKASVAIKAGKIPKDHVKSDIGQILLGLHPGRTSKEEITLFDSSGVAAQDVVVAEYICEKAKREGVGSRTRLFDGIEQLMTG